MSQLMRLAGVTLVRGGRTLFEGLDLKLNSGDALHIGGPNGSGKSSLLRLVAGLLRAERGTVERARCALADDKVALDRELPLGRALALWGGDFGQALDRIGLGALVEVPVRFLSSGQLKRATIARVIAARAPLWLLDEPLNALDSDGIDRLATVIAEHRADGGAVLAASHAALPGSWQHMELGR